MHTLVASPADNVIQLPSRNRAAAGTLADVELDRWANRLARLLLARGAASNTRIAMAVSPRIEAIVAESAVLKLDAIPTALADDAVAAPGAAIGITTKARRPHLSDAVDWLVLDDRSTLQRYLVSSDAPLTAADRRVAKMSA